ncbi:hypothetical protein ACFE04_003446 [Oxalis oulophora]
MPYNFINDVDASRDDWNIKVRLSRLWDVYNMQNEDDQFYIEMILLDEKGSPFHAVIRKNLITKYKPLLYEGRIYDIKNFKVIPASENYKPIKGDFKALFLLTTNVTELKHHPTDIPMYYFQFASYQQLQDRVGERSVLTDIIGKVVAIGKLEDRMANGRDNKIRRLQLLITENIIINVTLWRQVALQVNETSFHDDNNSVMIITSTLINKFKDALSINSTTNTRIYNNLNTSETTDIAARFADKKIPIRNLEILPNNPVDSETRMLKNRKTIKEILAITYVSPDQEKTFTITATVDMIEHKSGWSYTACEICMRKLKKEGDHFTCNACSRKSKYPTERFRMVLQVSDATGTTKLTLFDRDAQTLLSTTAVDLLISQNGDHDHIPHLLQNLCKRTFIFEIQLNDKNLKEGWENFTITKTFAPNQFLEKQIDNNNLTPATSHNNYKASPSITLMDNDIGECNDNETLANMLKRQRKSFQKIRSKKIHYSRNTT